MLIDKTFKFITQKNKLGRIHSNLIEIRFFDFLILNSNSEFEFDYDFGRIQSNLWNRIRSKYNLN